MTFKIQLVDDNPTFLAAIRLFIDPIPGVVIVGLAHEGVEALRQAREHQPDLVVLDVALPGMSGFDIAKELQSMPVPPRILFLSAHASAPYKKAALEIGALGFVAKSDFVQSLLPAIEALVGVNQGSVDPT